MNFLLNWVSTHDYFSPVSRDPRWAFVTIVLSAVLAIGYCAMAVNWYFQSKLSTESEARRALTRMRNICLTCAGCGILFYTTSTPWIVWRLYDLALLIMGIRTWWIVLSVRGVGLMDERLAQMQELERSAKRYREIAELLPHMVWTATGQGQIDFSNQKWREYVGGERTW